MILCNYISGSSTAVTYNFGAIENDITGIIRFNLSDMSFDVLKEPDKYAVYARSIHRLIGKYKTAFSKGEFGKKISFES